MGVGMCSWGGGAPGLPPRTGPLTAQRSRSGRSGPRLAGRRSCKPPARTITHIAAPSATSAKSSEVEEGNKEEGPRRGRERGAPGGSARSSG